MRTLQILDLNTPIAQVDARVPEPGPGEVRISIAAAGICRSDVHYRRGTRPVPGLPLVPGHEVAGTVSALGPGVTSRRVGERVCLHYLITCRDCPACARGAEQFCARVGMIGFDRQGGYAQEIVVPERNAVPVPDGVPLPWAAVLMCSTSTVFHALRRGRMRAGESVAVVGVGGLGASAVQVARAMGAVRVLAIDVNPVKLDLAERLGAIPIDAGEGPAAVARTAAAAGGADVSLELVGVPAAVRTAIDVLRSGGRAVAVGLGHEPTPIWAFADLVQREVEVIGAADHLRDELVVLLEWAKSGILDLSEVVTKTVPLEAPAVETALLDLEGFGDDVRTVIVP